MAVLTDNLGQALIDGASNALVDDLAILINTSTALTSSINPSIFNQTVIFTATVTPTSGPTGTVTFLDFGTPISGPIGLSGGIATFTISTLALGSHNITAAYSGDGTYNSSTSGALVQVVTGTIPVRLPLPLLMRLRLHG